MDAYIDVWSVSLTYNGYARKSRATHVPLSSPYDPPGMYQVARGADLSFYVEKLLRKHKLSNILWPILGVNSGENSVFPG